MTTRNIYSLKTTLFTLKMIVGEVDRLIIVIVQVLFTVHFTSDVTSFEFRMPVGQITRRFVICFFAESFRDDVFVSEVVVSDVVNTFNVSVGARADVLVVARAGRARSLAVVRHLVHVLVVQVESRSLGVVVVGARVVVVLFLVVALFSQLLLLALRRRHFGGVLFPPFCSSVLEPYLRTRIQI